MLTGSLIIFAGFQLDSFWLVLAGICMMLRSIPWEDVVDESNARRR